MRLIDADALLSGFDVRKVVEYDESGCGMDYKAVPVEAIANAPTIDAEPVRHGRWIDDMYFDEPVTRCTKCNHGFAKGHKAECFPYCPHCGAKMDLEVQDGSGCKNSS